MDLSPRIEGVTRLSGRREVAARALRRRVKRRELEIALAKRPQEVRDFWHVEADDPGELEPRII